MIDETLRLVTFSLMVFREAKVDVNLNGEFLASRNPYLDLVIYNLIDLEFRIYHSQGLESSCVVQKCSL